VYFKMDSEYFRAKKTSKKIVAKAMSKARIGMNPISAFDAASKEVIRDAMRKDQIRRDMHARSGRLADIPPLSLPIPLFEAVRHRSVPDADNPPPPPLPFSTQPECRIEDEVSIFDDPPLNVGVKEEPILIKDIRGRFGDKKPKFRWSPVRHGVFRIDDDANPNTSITLDVLTASVTGVVQAVPSVKEGFDSMNSRSAGSRFIVSSSHKGKTIRVDDECNFAFWLIVDLM
jgi:hypothetical protein